MWGVSLSLFALIVSLESRVTVCGGIGDGNVSRDDFPDGFVFGAASSSYQRELQTKMEGLQAYGIPLPKLAGSFLFVLGANNSVGSYGHMKEDTRDIACDGYHKYKFRILVRRNLRLNQGPLKGKETITMTRRTPCIRGACWGPTFTIIRSKNSPYSTLEDWSRAEYLQAFIGSSVDTIRNGMNVKGYFAWSFLDSFELLDGYESRFGLYYVDFDDPELKEHLSSLPIGIPIS